MNFTIDKKTWLKESDIYSIHNERKSVAAERFMRNLKNKNDRYMNLILKRVYILYWLNETM